MILKLILLTIGALVAWGVSGNLEHCVAACVSYMSLPVLQRRPGTSPGGKYLHLKILTLDVVDYTRCSIH